MTAMTIKPMRITSPGKRVRRIGMILGLVLVGGLLMSSDGYDTIDLAEMVGRASVIFIGSLADKQELTSKRMINKEEMVCRYSLWKVEKLLKGQPQFKVGALVQVYGASQFQDFSRAQDYRKNGVNYGIMVTYYMAATPADHATTSNQCIVFVYGEDPTNLVLVAENGYESIKLEPQILEMLANR